MNLNLDRIDDLLASAGKRCGRALRESDELLGRWERIPTEHDRRCRSLEQQRERLACEQFLRSQFLAEHEIPRIGPGRKQLLASFGIETAYDIEATRIRGIKGFGQVLTENLLAWRQSRLESFRFDPATEVPKEELERVAFECKHEQESLRVQIENDLHVVEIDMERLDQDLRPLHREVCRLLDRLTQAEADLSLVALKVA
jgi:DNA-binding helix-hairpin-helix protein with protein kinase domain